MLCYIGHKNSVKTASMWGRLRKWKFPDLALEVLIESVLNNHEQLYGALSASTSLGQKTKIWKDISEQVNAVDIVQRSVPDLKKRWYDFNRKIRKTVAANQAQGLPSGVSEDACLTALQAKVYAVMLPTPTRSSDGPDKRHSQEPYTDIPVKIEVKTEEWDLGSTSSLDEDQHKLASGITLERKQTSSVQPSARVPPTPVQVTSGNSASPRRTRSQASMPPHCHNSYPDEDSSVAGLPSILSLDFTQAHHPPATTTAWVHPTMAVSPINMQEEEDEEFDYMATVDPSQRIGIQHQHLHSHQVQWLAVVQRQADALERAAAAQERQAAATERAAQAQERVAAAQESAAAAQEHTLSAVRGVARVVRRTYAQVKHINMHLGKANQHAIHHTKVLGGLQAAMNVQGQTVKKQGVLMRRLSNMTQKIVAPSEHHMVGTSQSLHKLVKIMERKEQVCNDLSPHVCSEVSTADNTSNPSILTPIIGTISSDTTQPCGQ
ncbi:uncharacterized protein LOC144754269 [Lissotriton helveticus]